MLEMKSSIGVSEVNRKRVFMGEAVGLAAGAPSGGRASGEPSFPSGTGGFAPCGLTGRVQVVFRPASPSAGPGVTLSGDLLNVQPSAAPVAIPADILTLPESMQSDWVGEMEAQIAAGVLTAWLEGVFWAVPERKLSGALRLRLVSALYHRGVSSVEVQRLAMKLALVQHEPEAAIRQASFRFLLAHLRFLSPDEVLPVAVAGADPEVEPSAGVRRPAQEILRRWFPNLVAARRAVYRLVWQRQEASVVNRRKLLETMLHWLPQADASAQERLEGLYLLMRVVRDEREDRALRMVLAQSLLALDLSFMPAAVIDWVGRQMHPVCRQVMEQDGRVASGEWRVASGEW